MDTLVVDTSHLDRAVALAVDSVAHAGGPFGAVVVTADGQVFEGNNRVTQDNDPTAHAEVTAIRRACAALGTFDLTGATLYSSCEPCPMCLASALWARVQAVHYAADRYDAARRLRRRRLLRLLRRRPGRPGDAGRARAHGHRHRAVRRLARPRLRVEY